MALNPLYVLAPSPQVYFVDKDTGLPLAGGTVTFYSDLNRTDLKPVYELTGTPPNYTYTPLPNPMTLSSVGTMMDGSNNDIIPYYYPYDENGNIELYYIKVTAFGDTEPQFVREGWPNISSGAGGVIGSYANLIPNGQFLMHQDVYNSDLTKPNEISQGVTVLGQGGWTFERDDASTAKDIVTFNTISYTTNPTGNPRFQIEIQNAGSGINNTYKDLRIKFQDVNKFSTPANIVRPYRFAFTASSSASGTVPVEVLLIKNFGTGGSAQTETTIFTPTIALSDTIYQATFSFGDNSGKTIGTANDDFIQLAIRFPVDNLFDVLLTDFILMVDQGVITEYPNIPQADDRTRGIAGWMPTPAPDGSDNYLQLRLTPAGIEFDHGEIGQVIMETNQINYSGSLSTVTNNMLADGSTYLTTGYSPLSIPYSRLQQYYFSASLNAPIYGTGSTYLTCYTNSVAGELRITVNTEGAQVAATDGTPSTTFTFSQIHVGEDTQFSGLPIPSYTAGSFYLLADSVGVSTTATIGTTTFTLNIIRNESAVKQILYFVAVAGSSITGGQYILYSAPLTDYYLWFKVDNVGSDPAIVGRVGSEVSILSTWDAQTVAASVAEAIGGLHQDRVSVVAGSSIVPGSYFNITANSVPYYVWYKKDGVGTDPAPVGKVAIGPVLALTADTAAQVAFKTQTAINSLYFAAPNFQGLFLRGYDPNNLWDLDRLTRWSKLSSLSGDAFGTFEFDQVIQQIVSVDSTTDIFDTGSPGTGANMWQNCAGFDTFLINQPTDNANIRTVDLTATTTTVSTGITPSGTSETRPANAYVNYAIKY